MHYTGLTTAEASELLAKYGPNALRQLPRKPAWQKFIEQFKDFVVLLLLGAVVVSAFLGETLDAVVIFSIVVLNSIFGFMQESKAENSLEALKKMVAPQARVIRDNQPSMLEARYLVPGDIVLLEVGDAIPADIELLESTSLEADEAALTGESMPVHRKKGEQVFMGTIVTRGKGIGIVRTTGMQTKFGSVAALVQTVERESTPLEEQLEEMGKRLGIATIFICAIVFIVNWRFGLSFIESFLVAVTLAVAAVPEGLPAIVTVSLALGVQRMAYAKSIVRKLKAVETLGSTTFICTDKTGTLTRNEMVVKKLFADWKEYEFTGTGYSPQGDVTLEGKVHRRKYGDEVSVALHIAALCNSAYLKKEGERHVVIGDPTEGALLAMAEKGGVVKEDELESHKMVAELPFESDRKRMTIIYKHKDETLAFVKGQPESILRLCNRIYHKGKVMKLSEADRNELLEANKRYASQAFRVLALAYRPLDGKETISVEGIERELIFVGIAAMMDQPRVEAKAAISECVDAGISVVMITGDQKTTAEAVAQELGISTGDVLTGDQLDIMGDEDLAVQVKSVRVFAAVSPEHKLRIVSALKANGEVIAVTGDGVNDAPALKRADIGISMGITGTDVAKEASDMVLMDDNFATIVNAVREGRRIYDNIRKAVYYLLGCNVGEVFTVFVAALAGLGTPLLPIQLLWINLVTDGVPALSMALDPASQDIMQRKPRNPKDSILAGNKMLNLIAIGVLVGGATLAIYEMDLLQSGEVHARTLAFTAFVVMELAVAFAIRTKGFFLTEMLANGYLALAALASLLIQLAVVYLPQLQPIFKTVPLGISEWVLIAVAAVLMLAVLEAKKFITHNGLISADV
ncbi:MAG: cation-translocating P-type ATPase [Candidatus Micrarchaeia archaeon]|jgi:Ca2+-transporting ATPase